MPFVVLTGGPSCGKTTRATQLSAYLSKNCKFPIKIISDDDFGIDKNDVYADSRKEKELRGNLKSSVQRNIARDSIVILDSPNYIKGFRYELYCVTKSAQTPHCVIQCFVNRDTAAERNSQRGDNEKYNQDVFDGLMMRYESPESKNRWDSPLFFINDDEELPFKSIAEALLENKAPPPNKSTLSQPLSATNFLHELDKITQGTISVIMDAQKMSVAGDKITIPGSTEKVELTRNLTLAELQRLRRQFISFTKAHPIDDKEKLSNMFVQFINNGIR